MATDPTTWTRPTSTTAPTSSGYTLGKVILANQSTGPSPAIEAVRSSVVHVMRERDKLRQAISQTAQLCGQIAQDRAEGGPDVSRAVLVVRDYLLRESGVSQ